MKVLLTLVVLLFANITYAQSFQLMDRGQVERFRASFPQLEDDELNEKLHSDRLVLYTTTEMPPAYQMRNAVGRGATTVHSPFYNVSGDATDRGRPGMGNWNNELPWTVGKPGGAHISPTVTTVKGFLFEQPANVFLRDVQGDIDMRSIDVIHDWIFADQSFFVEVIYQRIEDRDYAFEIRTRLKNDDQWEFDIFRQFATAAELADELEKLGPGTHRAEAIADLRDKTKTLPTMRLIDSTHERRQAINVSSEVYEIPKILTKDILALRDLDRKWPSCFGMKFKGGASAPSNTTRFVNLVPPQYHGVMVHTTGTSGDCLDCHESAGRHGSLFQNRGAYGHIVGSYSDAILSWHPFAPSCISGGGGRIQPTIRQSFLSNGLVRIARQPTGKATNLGD